MRSKKDLKLLFVNPCLRPGGFTKSLPVGLASVITYFHENGYEFTLLDTDINEYDDEKKQTELINSLINPIFQKFKSCKYLGNL